MLATVCVLHYQALRWPLYTQWLLAMVVVLLIDPWALMQAGFWLSFVAVGMLFMAQQTPNKPRLGSYVWSLVQEQWRLSICLAPLGMVLFQQVSLVGLFANLLAIPWVTWVVTPLAFAGLLWPPLWQASAWAAQVFHSVLEPLAHLSWAVWHSAAPPWWVAAGGLVGAVLFAWRWRGLPRWVGFVLMLPALCWPPSRPPPGSVELLAADVGQGNAVLVRTAHHSLLFDAGPRYGSESDAGQRVLLPLLQTMNEKLDTLVLSHQDSDHTGGALSVYQMQPQAEVLTSIAPEHWIASKMPLQRCEAGQSWQWDGVEFAVLHPLPSDYEKLLPPNARSCVLRISASGQVVLLTADIEAFQELALVQRARDQLRADVLLVPHHGSKTSSTEIFLDAVQPRWALFQMGYRNRYGHPAPQVLERYIKRNIAFKLSPFCGAMTWRSESPESVRCIREENRRYWQYAIEQLNY
jgi:competence protein ComEC